jgi:DNA-damage-inducible protein J
MATKNIQLRLDEDLKKKAERVLEDLGLDMPTALRLFLKKLVRTKSIPFRISTDEDGDSFTATQIQEILAAKKEVSDPKNWIGPFHNANDAITSLHKASEAK